MTMFPETKGIVVNRRNRKNPIRDERAFADLKCRAEDGDQQAQFDLGTYYATTSLNHAFTPTFETICRGETYTSMKKPLEWCLKSAKQGHIEAIHWVIHCYEFGFGVCRDEKETVKRIRKIVDQGDSKGMLQMGCCYACCFGVPMDEPNAIKWWRKAAKCGQPSAESNLGGAHITGFGGVKGNKEKATEWIKSSAEYGCKPDREVFCKIEKWGFENEKNKIPLRRWQ